MYIFFLFLSSFQEGKHVLIDNTNPDVESRKRYITAAKKMNIPVRCFILNVTKDHSRHNNKVINLILIPPLFSEHLK